MIDSKVFGAQNVNTDIPEGKVDGHSERDKEEDNDDDNGLTNMQ